MDEQEKFNQWWESKGVNSVILRAQAWSAWLARAEAEQPQPAEDPDEWAIQDRVPARKHDEARWVGSITSDWCQVDRFPDALGLYHGDADDKFLLRLEVRCRRRDLPKVEQKKTTDDFGMYLESIIAKDPQLKAEVDAAEAELAAIDARLNEPQPKKTRIRLWMRNDPLGRPSLFACDQKPLAESDKYVEIHHDSEGFYVEEPS